MRTEEYDEMSPRPWEGWPRAVRACGHNPNVLTKKVEGCIATRKVDDCTYKEAKKTRLYARVWAWLRWIDPNGLGYRAATRWHYIRWLGFSRVLAYKREAPKPFLNLPKALSPGPKGPSS